MSFTFTDQDVKEFSDARMNDQKRVALRVLHRVSGVSYQDFSLDRGAGQHQAPSPASGAPLWDVCAHGVYPEDIYGPHGLQYYGTGDAQLDRAMLDVIRAAEGLVGAHLTVYRAVANEASANIIHPGDWVTPVRAYAEAHGEAHIGAGYKVLSARVTTRDLFTNGDSWLEWGYHPQEPLPRLIPGVLSLQETLAGQLHSSNALLPKLPDEMREQLFKNDIFVHAIKVYAKFHIGLSNGTEVVKFAQDSGQFEAELQAVTKNSHPVHIVPAGIARQLVAYGEKLSVIGDMLLWQQNTDNLGTDPVMQRIIAQSEPAMVNDIVLKVFPAAASLYEVEPEGMSVDMAPPEELSR